MGVTLAGRIAPIIGLLALWIAISVPAREGGDRRFLVRVY